MDRAESLSASMDYFRQEGAFRDGLGERLSFTDAAGAQVEHLMIGHDLSAVRSFEFALRDRVSRLASFRHPAFARVHGVERLAGGAGIVLVSDETAGVRLSTFLETVHARALTVEVGAAIGLMRQLLSAIAALHQFGHDTAHGALALERLVLTPRGRLIVVEHVMGLALEQLLWPPAKYWTELRVALPRTSGLARFDHATDVTQIGVASLALILGRPLQVDEYPWRITEVIRGAQATVAHGEIAPLHPALRSWVERAVQVDSRLSFNSAVDAHAAFDEAVAESGYEVSAVGLEQLLARYESSERLVTATATAFVPSAPTVKAAAPDPAPETSASSDEGRGGPESPGLDSPAMESTPASAVEPSRSRPALTLAAVVAMARTLRPVAVSRRGMRVTAAIVAAAAIGVLATLGLPRPRAEAAATASSTGTLEIRTEPPGAAAVVDGTLRGTTPVTVTLDAGWHRLELRGAGGVRTIPVAIKAGERASQFVDLPMSTTTAGQLGIATEPPGVEILVDGAPRGISPLVVGGLAPGSHVITARSRDAGTATQPVTLESGVATSVLLTLAAESVPTSGWIDVKSAFPIQIFEDGSLIGSSEIDRVMVTAGRHEFELKNEQLGYRTRQTVTVSPGKVATLSIAPPQGKLALNAQPWAEVWLDGTRVGETPIGNLSVPIGSHEIVFRHPELGEQSETALVTLTEPARVSVTFRK